MVSMDIGIWIAAFFTIAATSYVFKDNLLFKFAEHTFIGTAAGYYVAWNLTQLNMMGIEPMMTKGMYQYVLPIVLGLTVYFQYHKKYYWVARYGVAFMVGQGMGMAMRAKVRSDFIMQLQATIAPLDNIYGILVFVLVLTGLLHFTFTVKRIESEPFTTLIKIGRYGILIALGASFGNTVMTRLGQYQGRMIFLIRDWLMLIS